MLQAKMKASVVIPLLSSRCDSDDEDPTSEAQVWALVWAVRVNAVVDSIDGVTNDVENEHSQDRHMLADPGVTFDDFSAKAFNTACRRSSKSFREACKAARDRDQRARDGGPAGGTDRRKRKRTDDSTSAPPEKRKKRGGCAQSGKQVLHMQICSEEHLNVSAAWKVAQAKWAEMPEDERASYEDLAMKSQNAGKAAITADSVSHAQANVADTMGGSPHAAGL